MDINEMTVEQIEQYLQERKAWKSKLGGSVKLASEMQPGERGWVEIEMLPKARVLVGSNSAYPLQFDAGQLVETNVPERAPARRRMTAAEAAEQLKVGQEVWVKGTISGIDKGHKLPIALLVSKDPYNEEWYWEDTEIEVDE